MNEGEFRAKLNELGTSYQLAIKRMNAVDSPGLKDRHRRAASEIIDEIQALERKHKVEGDGALGRALWEGKRTVESFKIRPNDLMIVVDPEITYRDGRDTEVVETWSGQSFLRSVEESASPDPQRELKWWEDQYASKLSDRTQDNGRTPPTVEELRYFEDKIRELGGQVSRVDPVDPAIELFNRRIQDWVALERRLESIFEEDRAEERAAKTATNSHLRRDVFIGTLGIVVACYVIAQALIWAFGL